MNDYELMRKSEQYDEAITLDQFTHDEIMEIAKQKNQKFKDNYFDFYDDIKHHSKPKQDW